MKIKETLEIFLKTEKAILTDPKIKTLPRKKLRILDEWHWLWDNNIRNAISKNEIALCKAYYNMYSSTVANTFDTMEQLDKYIEIFVHTQLIGAEWAEKESEHIW